MSEDSVIAHPAESGQESPPLVDQPTAEDQGASSAPSSRFIGDLNPEGMFAEATTSGIDNGSSTKGDVGIWLSVDPSSTHRSAVSMPTLVAPILNQLVLSYVKQNCVTLMPPKEDFRHLKDVYLQKIHPIFPVIPEAVLEEESESPASIVLKQVTCLAAATDPTMAGHLRLTSKGKNALPYQEFSQLLSGAIRASLDTSLISNRIVHIRALILLSLYCQPSSAQETDLPAQFGARAIHHVQTLGLHLLQYDVGQGSEELEALFCAAWALDRLNAAAYGRPCLIHERDIGAKLDDCIRKRSPCFRLFLMVVQWLDKVIELYRPGPSAEASGYEKIVFIDLPVLEAMIVDAGALNVPTPLIGKDDNPFFFGVKANLWPTSNN
jgi:hypothetical protein